jgi:hypothetical protein
MRHFCRSYGFFLAASLAAAGASGDEVFLHGGGRVSGMVVERNERVVVIETGPGRVTLPMTRVLRIVDGRSSLNVFQERAGTLAPGDAAGWTSLARWAADHDLVTQSRAAWQRVLAVDPQNPEANAALGRVSLEGAWMSADDAYRARGFVQYDGHWMTPAEHAASMRERAADQEAQLQAREADLRVREAEARAREAEARARDAESGSEYSDSGIPYYPYVFPGYGPGYGYGYGGGYRPAHPIGPRMGGFGPGRPSHGPGMRPNPAPSPAPMPSPAPRPVHRSAAVAVPPRQVR